MYTIDYWLKDTNPHYDGKRHTMTLSSLYSSVYPSIEEYFEEFAGREDWYMYNVYNEEDNVTKRVTTPPHHEDGVGEIAVGCGVTEYCWSDRHAYEIIEIKSKSTIVVRELRTRRTDDYGVSDCQNYAYYHNYTGNIKTLRKVKRGRGWCWIEWGKGGRSKGANTFGVGTAREFYDYCF